MQTQYRTIDLDASPATGSQRWSLVQSVMAASGLCLCMGVAFVAGQSATSQSSLYAVSSQVAARPAYLSATGAVNRAPSAFAQRPASMAPMAQVEQGPVAVESLRAGTSAQAPFAGAVNGLTAMLLMIPAAVTAAVWALKQRSAPTHAMMALSGETVNYSPIEFPKLTNDRLLRAARGEPVDRIPVWIMRQAGRYLPEYREFMKTKEFFAVCKNPKEVAEITLQPIDRYDLDASIIFSDILVIPQAMGMGVKLVEQVGPVFDTPVSDKAAWENLQDSMLKDLGIDAAGKSAVEKTDLLVENSAQLVTALDYVYDAITETRTQLNGRVPLLGFCGAPMTLFVYMVEGQGSRTFTKTAEMMYGDPETANQILTVLAHMCAAYLANQVRAGAQALQVFDSYAGGLSPEIWNEFSLPYMQLIAKLIKEEFPQMPLIGFAKDAHYALDVLSESQYDIVALDSSLDLGECHKMMTAKGKSIQGNFDPTTLYAPPQKIHEIVTSSLKKAFGDKVPTNYIGNMGHGMSPDHDPEHLRAFIDAIHSHGQK